MENIEKEYDKLLESADFAKEVPDITQNAESIEEEKGVYKKANILYAPETGEQKIVSTENEEFEETVDEDTFEDLLRDIEEGKVKVETDNSPITKEELKENITVFNPKDDNKFDISDESLEALLKIANRKMNKEEFNVYKELPQEIKNMIDKTIGVEAANVTSNEIRYFKNSIAEQLLNDFIMNITINRAKSDLNKEIESVFNEGLKDIAEESVKYTEERNKQYRAQVEAMEDQGKRAKLLAVLDTMDSAYDLNDLKEFAKTCKLKKYDIEDPKRYFRDFHDKYKDSTYNIYDIKLTLTPLTNKIVDNEKYTEKDIIAFLVCFCKYVMNFNVEDTINHTFMYYVIYNIIIMGSNTSEKTIYKSNMFANNIKEVIDNLKVKNSFLN